MSLSFSKKGYSKYKMKLLITLSLFLLNSCSNNNINKEDKVLNTDLKFENVYLCMRDYANVKGHLFKNKKTEILEKELIVKTFDFYKYIIENKLEYTDWTDVDGFSACNYYNIRFGDGYLTGILFDPETDYFYLFGYNKNNDWQRNKYKNGDDYSKKYFAEVIPTFKEMLDSVEWVLD